jgi:hypothetical protein
MPYGTFDTGADPGDVDSPGVVNSGNGLGPSAYSSAEPTPAESPSQIAADLLNAEYNEWASTFKPIELSMLNEISFNNPSVLTTAVSKASTAAQQTSDTMSGVLSRTNKSQGLTPNVGQQNTMNRMVNLNTAENVASASNQARENVRIQDEQILLGSLPNYNIQKGTSTAG